MRIGYFLSCEEYTPAELVEQAVAAEEAGFDALWISDHYHPGTTSRARARSCGASSARCRTPALCR